MKFIFVFIYYFCIFLIPCLQLLAELIGDFLKTQPFSRQLETHNFLTFPKRLLLVERCKECFGMLKKTAIPIVQTTTSELIDQMRRRPLQIFVFNGPQSFKAMLIKSCRSCAHHKLYSSSPKAG